MVTEKQKIPQTETFPKERLKRMRRIALALLIAVLCLWVLARLQHGDSHWGGWQWIEAFAEAAVVGGLADWFAVTALFRRPLGLPIPHTGIVSQQKARIGRSIGRFLNKNFLTGDTLTSKLHEWQPLQTAARWAEKRENSERIVETLSLWWKRGLTAEKRNEFSQLFAEQGEKAVQSIPVRKTARFVIVELLRDDRHRTLFAPLFQRLGQLIKENEKWITAEARKEAPLKDLPVIGKLSSTVSHLFGGLAVGKVQNQLSAASENSEHPLHDQIKRALSDLYHELDEDKPLSEDWEKWRIAALENGTTHRVIQSLLKLIDKELEKQPTLITDKAKELLPRMIKKISNDQTLLDKGHFALIETAQIVTDTHSRQIEDFIAEIVNGWETSQLVEKLETQIGPDLQYVRINGTLIGGLIGLIIHSLGLFLDKF